MEEITTQLVNDVSLKQISLSKAITAAIVVVVMAVIIKLTGTLLERQLKKTGFNKGLHSLIKSLVRIGLVLITIIIVAEVMGVSLSVVVALLSVMGLALSLAVQGIISNIAGGLVVLYYKPLQLGDFIKLNDVSGIVTDIKLVYTVVHTLDDTMVSIPNSEISSQKIVNYTRGDVSRVEYIVGASYDDEPAQVKKALLEAARAVEGALQTPPPFAETSDYKESYIEYTVRVWVPADKYRQAYYQLVGNIREAYDRNGVHMTYNHLNVHMVREK